MDEAAALRAESPLLYELVVHGSGWRYEQTPSAEADDGWRNVRELPCEDGPDGSPPTAADGGSATAPAGSVLVDGSAGTLRDQALWLLRLSWRYWQAQTSPWPSPAPSSSPSPYPDPSPQPDPIPNLNPKPKPNAGSTRVACCCTAAPRWRLRSGSCLGSGRRGSSRCARVARAAASCSRSGATATSASTRPETTSRRPSASGPPGPSARPRCAGSTWATLTPPLTLYSRAPQPRP